MKTTPREAAYKTLQHSLSMADVARELGVCKRFVRDELKRGGLIVDGDGRVSGVELAKYLAAHRRG